MILGELLASISTDLETRLRVPGLVQYPLYNSRNDDDRETNRENNIKSLGYDPLRSSTWTPADSRILRFSVHRELENHSAPRAAYYDNISYCILHTIILTMIHKGHPT